jgi:citrate lyase subunit beta/citryl-CoA lyase
VTPVTYLFVPGDRPERFGKALAAGADAVIIDLEDAVAAAAKESARANLAAWMRDNGSSRDRVLVRVNDAASAWFAQDLAAVAAAGVQGVVLSKTESAAHVAQVRAALPSCYVVCLVETARGIASVEEICAAPGVQRLAFGTLDYAMDLALGGDDRGLAYPSSRMAIASRCAGLAAPVAGVTPSIDDAARLRADLDFARAHGFGAKLCIHPRQVAMVREAMRPTAAEIEWATRVIAATAGGAGAVQVDGRMVDRPVILRAEQILARSNQ